MREIRDLLIAEDDEGHAALIRRQLTRSGFDSAVRLRDGQELLDYLYRRGAWSQREAHGSMAILVDLNMPRLGGYEVLQRLKADKVLTRIPVFVLTTTDNPLELDRCYEHGAAGYFVKPMDYGAFGEMIHRLAQFLAALRLPTEAPATAKQYGL